MADILDAAQTNTGNTPTPSDTQTPAPVVPYPETLPSTPAIEPPLEPSPEPMLSAPTPLTSIEDMLAAPASQPAEPPPFSEDSLIVPPLAQTPSADEPPLVSVPPEPSTSLPKEPTPAAPVEELQSNENNPKHDVAKKKSSMKVLLAGLVVLLVSLPLIGFAIQSGTELRSKAADPYKQCMNGCAKMTSSNAKQACKADCEKYNAPAPKSCPAGQDACGNDCFDHKGLVACGSSCANYRDNVGGCRGAGGSGGGTTITLAPTNGGGGGGTSTCAKGGETQTTAKPCCQGLTPDPSGQCGMTNNSKLCPNSNITPIDGDLCNCPVANRPIQCQGLGGGGGSVCDNCTLGVKRACTTVNGQSGQQTCVNDEDCINRVNAGSYGGCIPTSGGGTTITLAPTNGGGGGGGGGGGNGGSCSADSAASCQGKSPGAACNNGNCKELPNQKGGDGKSKCSCQGGGDPTPTPMQCVNIKIYKNDVLTTPSSLQPGDVVTLGYTPGTGATKIRFRVTVGTTIGDWQETTTKNSGEFRLAWTVPTGATAFSIESQYFNGSAWH